MTLMNHLRWAIIRHHESGIMPIDPQERLVSGIRAWLGSSYWRWSITIGLVFAVAAAAVQMLGLAGDEGLSGRQVYWLGALTFLTAFVLVLIVASLVSVLRRLLRRG